MKAVRGTCVLIALAFFVQAIASDAVKTAKDSESPSAGTSLKPNVTTAVPTSTPTTTTPKLPTTPSIPTTTNATDTTTAATTTTSTSTTPKPPPETTTPVTTTTSTKPTPPPAPNTTTTSTTTTEKPTTTTAVPTTPGPTPAPSRHFDGLSFLGGMILAASLIAIGFVLWKVYKARTERNYHTL